VPALTVRAGIIGDMRSLFAVVGWVVAAVAAIGIGLAGVRAIGNGITAGTGGDVLTAEDAARELAAAPPLPSPGSPSRASSGTPSGSASGAVPPAVMNVRVFGNAAGSVQAGCLPAGAKIISSSAAIGYGIKESRLGPGEYAEVRFDRNGGNSGKGNGEVRVRIRCGSDGVPAASWS
jgi:hypothetical protein